MKLKKNSILFSLVLVSALLLQNGANANSLENEINSSVLGDTYVQDTVYDAAKISQMSYAPRTNNLDIDAYTSMTKEQRQMKKMENKVAASDTTLSFDPINAKMEDANIWVRPYGSFEHVKTGMGKIKSNNYGVYAGVNSGIRELGNGWDVIWGGYSGYVGGYISDHYDSMYQNGGTLGFENMFMKGNFFTGFNASIGGGAGNLNGSGDDPDIIASYINSGIANKTGYNWELADGKFIIQPNMVASYVFAHTFGNTKHYGDGNSLSIENDSLHAVQLEPGINFIGNFGDGWQPYVGVSVVWNIMHSQHVAPWYAAMPEMATRPFVKYGAGLRKNWDDRYSASLQAFVRNGGRSGVGIQGGFGVALGK